MAHSTNYFFEKEKKIKIKSGEIVMQIKPADLCSFNELERDVEQIGDIIQKYANLLNVKVDNIDKHLKKNYTELPKITSQYIEEKDLFYPLF